MHWIIWNWNLIFLILQETVIVYEFLGLMRKARDAVKLRQSISDDWGPLMACWQLKESARIQRSSWVCSVLGFQCQQGSCQSNSELQHRWGSRWAGQIPPESRDFADELRPGSGIQIKTRCSILRAGLRWHSGGCWCDPWPTPLSCCCCLPCRCPLGKQCSSSSRPRAPACAAPHPLSPCPSPRGAEAPLHLDFTRPSRWSPAWDWPCTVYQCD